MIDSTRNLQRDFCNLGKFTQLLWVFKFSKAKWRLSLPYHSHKVYMSFKWAFQMKHEFHLLWKYIINYNISGLICNLIIFLLLLPHRLRLRHSLRQRRSFSKAENKKVFCLSLWNTWKLYLCVCVSCVCYHILLSWRRRDKETSRLLSNILTLNPKDCNNQFCSVTQ